MPPAFHQYPREIPLAGIVRREWAGRLLATATGEDAETYRIVQDDALVIEFRTAGINGKTPDETAEANLADLSETYPGEFLLFRDAMIVAYSEGGIIYSLRPDNPALVRGREETAA